MEIAEQITHMCQNPIRKLCSLSDLLGSAILGLILLACMTLLSGATSQSVVAGPAGATSGVGMREAGLTGSASTGPFSGPTPACTPVWSVVDSPNPSADGNNDLIAVAARAPDDVWAVGAYHIPDVDMTLVEHWDGATWRVVP